MRITDKDKLMLQALRDGELTTRLLYETLGVSSRTVQKRAEKLMAADLIHKPSRGKYALTIKGQDALTLGEEIGSDFGVLTELIDNLPSELHRALMRNLIRAVIGRYHLEWDNGLPSALVMGPTGIGKTFSGELMTRMLGYEPGSLCKDLRARGTKGELLGRFSRQRGSDEVTFKPSTYLSKPFFILDELDKADSGILQDALYLIKGSRYALIEEQRVEIKPTVLITLNQNIEEPAKVSTILDEAVLRRCFPINFYPVALDIPETRKRLRDIANKPVPQLSLEELKPIKTKLSVTQEDLLEQLMASNLNDDGARLLDLQPTELLILADSAFTNSIEESIYAVMHDLLLGAHTFGWVNAGWRERLLESWADYRGLSEENEDRRPLPKEAVELVDRQKQKVKQTSEETVAAQAAVGEFIQKRSQLAQAFGDLHDKLFDLSGRQEKRMTKGSRDKLKHDLKSVTTIDNGDETALEVWYGIYKKEQQRTKRFLDLYAAHKATLKRRKDEVKKHEQERRNLSKTRKEYEHFYKRKRTNKDEDVLAILMHLDCVRESSKLVDRTIHPDWIDQAARATRNITRHRKIWKRFEISTLKQWAAEPLSIREKQNLRYARQALPREASDAERAFALSVLQRLASQDPTVRYKDQMVEVEFDNPPEAPLQATTVKRELKTLLGCDAKEYSSQQLERWESLQVKGLLKHKLAEIDGQIELTEHELEQLASSAEENSDMLAASVANIIDI